MERDILSTNRKALKINLNPAIFESFTKTGSGQEFVRQFIQTGGASGTIANTISACDEAYSDALHKSAESSGYASEARLDDRLETEYNKLTKIPGIVTGTNSIYFCFAIAVEILKYRKNNRRQGRTGRRSRFKSETEAGRK